MEPDDIYDVTKGTDIYNQLGSLNLFDHSLRLPCFCSLPNILNVQQSITFSGKLKATLCLQKAANRGLIMQVWGRILESFPLD